MSGAVEWLNWLDLQTSGFLQGATSMASVVVTLIFLRFWRRTGDRLFMAFAVAFLIFAVSRALLAFTDDDETRTYIYLLRLAAFVVIIGGIVDKNRAPPPTA